MKKITLQESCARADLVESAVSRALGLAESILFMTEDELTPIIRSRPDVYRNAVQELATILKDSLSPALEAAGDIFLECRDLAAAESQA